MKKQRPKTFHLLENDSLISSEFTIMLEVEFDDLIYYLQKSGGASRYWREITSRIGQLSDVSVSKSNSSKMLRGVPVHSKAQIFHSSHFRISIGGKAKTITTAHDMIYEKGLITNGIGSKLNILERKLSFFTADAIICISTNTKTDLLQVYPSLETRCPIYIIHHGANLCVPRAVANSSEDLLRRDDTPYILYVGSRDGYKNFRGALEGYLLSGLWRSGVKLVCTGNGFNESELLLFKKMRLDSMVECQENVSITQMCELYSNAFCLLYTSSYEGFGLPPIEAMSVGCPVIASNTSSIPEIVEDAGILIDPFDHDCISRAIVSLNNVDFRRTFIIKGLKRSQSFTWDISAKSHLNVYKETCNLKQDHSHRDEQ